MTYSNCKKIRVQDTGSHQEEIGYAAHRKRQRLRILSAAEDLFLRSGVDRVSMLEITAASGLQPSTLYQYFKRKEDIVWAITAEILSDFQHRATARLEGQRTTFRKLEALLELMSEDLASRPEKVRFMAQFDVLYARDLSAESLLDLERKLGIAPVSELRHWAKAGTEDGSMNPNPNLATALLAVLNAAIGTQRRLACLEGKVEQEYGEPSAILFREATRIMLSGLKPQTVHPRPSAAKTATAKSKEPTTRRSRS